MQLHCRSLPLWRRFVAGAACAVLSVCVAHAEPAASDYAQISIRGEVIPVAGRPVYCPPPVICPPLYAPPPLVPGTPAAPATPGAPATTTPSAPSTETAPSTPEPAAPSATLGELAAGGSAVGGNFFSGVGYIDSAIPVTQYRLRVDAAYDDNVPDRADFFYPKCGCFRAFGIPAPGPVGPGNTAAQKVNYQEITNYFEYAPNRQVSAFINLPQRFVDFTFFPAFPGAPTTQASTSGFSDLDFGAKYAFLYTPARVMTFQGRFYAPTGAASLGLGRNNWVFEPALLGYQRLTDRMFLEAEFLDFIPLAANDDFAGNVLRYGVGLSYLVYNRPNFRVAPVSEWVGWTVLSGKAFEDTTRVVNAAGQTIVNTKIGVRFGFGRMVQPGFLNRADLYVGYGRALTGDVWYKDIVRTELRIRF